jgi:1-acyl-sn-glycerol-3-phosphate acyltransferase
MLFIINFLRPLVGLICRVIFRTTFNGVENVPKDGPCVITPNHVTYADPIWITIPIKRRVYYMTWDKIFDIPILGAVARTFGAFPVKLEGVDLSAQREAIDLVNSGKALVIFPEGGRSKTGALMPYKQGAFRLALTHGVPIIPVAIEGGYQIWPVGRWIPRPGRVTVTYFPAVAVARQPADITNAELKQKARLLASEVRETVATRLEPKEIIEAAKC